MILLSGLPLAIVVGLLAAVALIQFGGLMPKKSKYFLRARSAINGAFVSLAYAKRHPRTTIVEKVRRT